MEQQATPDSSVYTDSSSADRTRQSNGQQLNGQDRPNLQPPDPVTDFQRLAKASTGEMLPIFERDLFRAAPSTFAPGDQIAIAPDYLIGPGDEVLLRVWGPQLFNGQLTVDRSGSIYVPKVGPIHVAGLRFDELKQQITADVQRVYRNFEMSVNLGRLRSVQIYVVGEARFPGAYTISSLSTVLNALFACGGPSVQGSLRHIQVRRPGQPDAEFDLYDFVLHGDRSKDIRLQSGDTIYIPPVGPQAALAGSVRHPAIYELVPKDTVNSLLELAGGLDSTADASSASLERIHSDNTRSAVTVTLDATGRGTALRDGDVIFVNHIAAGYEATVSIRGNLANPGRFAWHEGMKLSEIIPDKRSLLTPGYWEERNSLGIPVPLFSRADGSDSGRESEAAGGNIQASSSQGLGQARVPIAGTVTETTRTAEAPSTKRNVIQVPAPEIDWSYAVIERLDPESLKSTLVPFNLGKLVEDHDAAQNLSLLPGDIVTILSQKDLLVSRDQQTKFIRLEGEFASSGVYSVQPTETLADVVRRAGGLTSKAYLYGSNFTRESARIFQQQRLDEYVSSVSADMERSLASSSAITPTGSADQTALAGQRLLIGQLRQARATGRVVLEFTPESIGVSSIPNLALEDGDVFRVPPVPNTVSVVGAVYGQNVFLYSASRRVGDYVVLAGGTNRVADPKHAFVIRADGSIYSRERAQGPVVNHFDSVQISPGDSIVIPEKLIKPPAIRALLEYSQILSSFGLAAAAINVVR